jgi:hypothetical protein
VIVLAGAWDDAARDFVARHALAGVSLLVPRDLSRCGWRYRSGDPADTVMVARGRRFLLSEVGGVLTRLPAVTDPDLPHIAAADRAYVAAELTAFLLAVLASATVPVLNAPTPQWLCGPAWQDARWRRVAHRCGFAVKEARSHAILGAAATEEEPPRATVTVVGDACVGAPNPVLSAVARAVAKAAGAALLTVEFDDPGPHGTVLRASPLVDLGDPLVEAAVLRLFGVAGGGQGRAEPDDLAVGG